MPTLIFKMNSRPRTVVAAGKPTMAFFHRLRIIAKLLTGFGVLLAILASLSGWASFGALSSKGALAALSSIKDREVLDQRAARRLSEAQGQIWMALATGDSVNFGKAEASLQIASNMLDDLAEGAGDSVNAEKLKTWTGLIQKYRDFEAKLQNLKGRNEAFATIEGKQAVSDATLLGAGLANAGEALNRQLEADALQLQSFAALRAQWLFVGSLAAGGVSLMIGGALAYFITLSIKRPILTLTHAMDLLANGDLDVVIPGVDERNEIGAMARSVEVFKTHAHEKELMESEAHAQSDETERQRQRSEAATAKEVADRAAAMRHVGDGLKSLASGNLTARLDPKISSTHAMIINDFNESVARLNETMRVVVDSANAIHEGAQVINDSSDQLTERAESQAASLEETAASLGEITETVKRAASGAGQARALVAVADADAKKGAVVVRQAVAAMDGILKSSGQITQIIGVIDEIAFQTNLLALNAGVEAARAGDSGRGFAVVAMEVRALAQRSTEAAKEIKTLISNSSKQVADGVKLVAATGQTLETILAQVTRINDVVGEIAVGAQQQAVSLAAVSAAINEMDKATQENASMVEHSNASGRSLGEETERLTRVIGQFRLIGETPRPGRRAA